MIGDASRCIFLISADTSITVLIGRSEDEILLAARFCSGGDMGFPRDTRLAKGDHGTGEGSRY